MLQSKAEKMDEAAKAEFEKRLEAFKNKEEGFKQKLEKMMVGTDQDRQKIVATLVSGMNGLEDGFDKILQKL